VRFTRDNTAGYSQVELDALNAEFVRRAGDETNKSLLDQIAERVMVDLDRTIAPSEGN
jgi:hypothetical protein